MAALSGYSPSSSPRSISPAFTDSSDQDSTPSDHEYTIEAGSDQPGSPNSGDKDKSAKNAEPDAVTCLWDDCGVIFTHLPTLITHIHDDHIGVHKSNYTCEWSTCSRRGLAQTSRFALISHIRSHTGEKPFTCPLPECDKSFTRSDALAKHMRLQHNIEPPLPGRGGNRKRKRNDPTDNTNNNSPNPASPAYTTSTFKVESSTPVEFYIEEGDGKRVISPIDHVRVDYFSTSHTPANPPLPPHTSVQRLSISPPDVDDGEDEDDDDPLMHAVVDPATGLIMGRSPAMVRYLITKAKYQYALEQHEMLIEELRMARVHLGAERREKEEYLDHFLRATFGAQADHLLHAPHPENGHASAHGRRTRRRRESEGVLGAGFVVPSQ